MDDTVDDSTESRSIRVAVCDQRKLFRQVVSIWLAGQDDLELVTSGPTLTSVVAACEAEHADAAIVTLVHESDVPAVFLEAHTTKTRMPELRLLAVTEYAVEETSMFLDNGFQAVINATAGAAGLLRSLRTGRSALPNVPEEETTTDPGPLTPRETEVLSLVGQGSTMEDISEELGISPSTVASHKERIFDKLDANNQAHAVAKALDLGLMPGDAPEASRS